MQLDIYAVPGSQADGLRPFIRPGVWELPDRGQFWYLAAVDRDRQVVGAAVIDPAMDEAALLSIGVSPSCLRRGVASELLGSAIGMLDKAKIPGLRVSCALPPADWQALGNLLELNGFSLQEMHYAYTARLDELLAHPMLAQPAESPHFVSVAALSRMERGELAAYLGKMGVSPVVLQECAPAYSFVARGAQGFEAMFLLGQPGEGTMENLWTWLRTAGSSRMLVGLLSLAFHKAAETCPPETNVLFTCVNEASDRLLHHFLPDRQPTQCVRVYYSGTEPAEDAGGTTDWDSLLGEITEQQVTVYQ